MNLSGKEIITIILSALQRGQRVRMSVKGISMLPFLHEEDVVELTISSDYKLGDIVLVNTSLPGEDDRYVLHRIVKFKNDNIFYIRGDSQFYTEGPFNKDDIIGRVNKFWSNGQEYNNNYKWRSLGLLWIYTSPFSPLLLKIFLRIRFTIRSILKKVFKY